MDHHERAEASLSLAHQEIDGAASHRLTSLATAHAVLALIDIITGDRENEIQEANDHIEELGERLRLAQDHIFKLHDENQALKLRVRELADQLDGCNDTVRRHEQAATNELNAAKVNADYKKSYE